MSKRKTTARGFAIFAEMKDSKGQDVRVQKSSIADADCVWIFCSKDGVDAYEHMGRLVSHSPHLTPKQARKLARALLEFADEAEPDDGSEDE